MRLLNEPDSDDPILSVVNLIDLFLVIIAALLIAVARNPLLNPFAQRDVTVVVDAGKPSMQMLVKKGEKLERYQASGAIGEGEGVRAGTAYRLRDGTLVYVPEGGSASARP
ncbi:MAG: DUF2149 domain-containing protein [Thiobacillaceae bacterium]|nr:DUF2149 domain-containing protein [Thiobacillaceae bacterium]MDW8324446.1 DUF2149 domain-containing protein [Burkholderiales bacterium]